MYHIIPYHKRSKPSIFFNSFWQHITQVQSIEERWLLFSSILRVYGKDVLHNETIVKLFQDWNPPINKFTIPDSEKLKFDLSEVAFSAGGAFGCVGLFEHRPLVVKIEVSKGKEVVRNKQEYLLNVLTGNAYLQFPYKNPFAIATYECYVIPSKNVPTELALNPVVCETLKKNLSDKKTYPTLQVTISQKASDGTLAEWSPESLMTWQYHVAFQLLYAITCNYSLAGIIHKDIKIENVVVDKIPNKSIHIHIGKESFYYQYDWRFCLIDFGLSISNLYELNELIKRDNEEQMYKDLMVRGTPPFQFPARCVYMDIKTKKPIEGYENELKSVADDVWSVGILLFETALRKWAEKNKKSPLGKVVNTELTMPVMNFMDQLLGEEKYSIDKKVIPKDSITITCNVLLLQQALENDFKKQLKTQIQGSFLAKYTDQKLMNNLTTFGKKWNGRVIQPNTFFVTAVEALNKGYGADFVNIIKMCLHWDYKEREKIITEKRFLKWPKIIDLFEKNYAASPFIEEYYLM